MISWSPMAPIPDNAAISLAATPAKQDEAEAPVRL
jgi:hypothetical protein